MLLSKINYRKDQIPIMNYEQGTMAVPAVPGAGKTFIVTNLVAKLLVENRNEKGKILILTYMNSAANNFKGRIKKILEEKGIDSTNGFEVMTIHSLAAKIIKEKPEVMMLSEDFNIADDLQKTMMLNDCINTFRASGGESAFRYFLKEQKSQMWYDIQLEQWESGFFELVAKAISSLKYNDISPQKLEENILSNKGILKIISFIYKDYDKKLKQNGLLDYDDLLIYAYKTLCIDEELKDKFQNRYKYVFEDECQDSNEIQGKIIKLICEKHNNLVRVGDVNQSITGTFSSSDPKFFKEFMNEAQHCYKMNMSNRSSSDILDLANNLVQFVCNDLGQEECKEALQNIEIETVEKGQGYKENPEPDTYQINSTWYKTFEEEIDKTVKFVKGLKSKYPDKSIGILVPYNSQLSQVSKVLEQQGLEFEELGPNSKNKRRIIDNLSKIINFIVNCDEIEVLIDTLSNVFIKTDNKEGKNDFLNILRGYTVEELLYSDIKDKPLIIDDQSEMYLTFKQGLDSLVEILEHSTTKIDELILFIKDRLDLKEEEKSLLDYVAFYVRYLSNEMPNITIREILDILSDSRNKVFNYMIEVVYEINGYEPQPGSITVCNYHKSKGMEWDCVFLLQLTQFHFPDNIGQKFQCEKWYLKDKYKNTEALVKSQIDLILHGKLMQNHYRQTKIEIINEKIRLLYVGITRAKEMLVMMGSSYQNEEESKNSKKIQQPSLYLMKLNELIQNRRGMNK
ncbi:ATP-dependent helicase [Intestinibacter sp.]